MFCKRITTSSLGQLTIDQFYFHSRFLWRDYLKAALGPGTQLAGLNEDLMTQDSVVYFSVYLRFPTNHSNAPYSEGTMASGTSFGHESDARGPKLVSSHRE